LINQIGIADTQDGYEQIKKIWLNYRNQHPKLDHYLPDWASDYAVVNGLPVHPLEIYAADTPTFSYAQDHVDILLDLYLNQKIELTLPLIDALIEHRIDKSKFFLSENGHMLSEVVPQVIQSVDAHLRLEGKGIFQRYRPPRKTPLYRVPFESVIYSAPQYETKVADLYRYGSHQPLREFLNPIVKHSENLLREQTKHRGRLQVKNLDEDIKAVIKQQVSTAKQAVEITLDDDQAEPPLTAPIPPRKGRKRQPTPKVAVEIDHSKIEQLQQESEDVFELLSQEVLPNSKRSDKVINEAESQKSGSSHKASPETLAEPIVIDAARVQQLDQQSQEVFDLLDSEESTRPKPSEGTSNIQAEVESAVPAFDIQFDTNIDEDWLTLANALESSHRKILATLMDGKDVRATADEIARQNATMPSMLFGTARIALLCGKFLTTFRTVGAARWPIGDVVCLYRRFALWQRTTS